VRSGRKNGFVAEVVRLPTFGELAARILTNSATSLLARLLVFCKPVLAPVRSCTPVLSLTRIPFDANVPTRLFWAHVEVAAAGNSLHRDPRNLSAWYCAVAGR